VFGCPETAANENDVAAQCALTTDKNVIPLSVVLAGEASDSIATVHGEVAGLDYLLGGDCISAFKGCNPLQGKLTPSI
jgi:hypothetical protein